MRAPSFDPGLTQQFDAPLRRVVNKDGTFNVRRRGTTWRDVHPYLRLIEMSWPRFLGVLFAGYILVNLLFAVLYFQLGAKSLVVPPPVSEFERFMDCFFFSAQTVTTVGYGTIAPIGIAANLVATFEAMLGLMGLSLGTGLLFGRISRPSARIGFSSNLVVAPYQDGESLQFRVVNKRSNTVMNVEATVLMMTVEREDGKMRREYKPLRLERPGIMFFPLTWTVVHPLDQESPLFGMSPADLERLQAEFLILVKGFDETFSQTVHARYSYRYDEIIWGTRFVPAFHVNESGDLILEVDQVGAVLGPGAGGAQTL
jgi:inward rectifier potassium channel